MIHRHILIIFLFIFSSAGPNQYLNASEKPVQHLDLPEVTSIEEANRVFAETTAKLKQKTKLDDAELQEIHIITYSLERAIAYFAQNLVGEKQLHAEKMAELVEQVHLESENNRATSTAEYLKEYFGLAERFSSK